MICPGAAFVEMALAATRDLAGEGALIIDNIEMTRALFIGGDDRINLQFHCKAGEDFFEIYSRAASPEAAWILHATGYLRSGDEKNPPRRVMLKVH